MAHGIMFHHFHGGGHPPGQGSISGEQLDAMIRRLGRGNILSAEEWMRRAIQGRLRDSDLCLTFDDNLRCQYDVALEVLKTHQLTGFWFIYTSVLEGKLERLELYRKFRTSEFVSVEDFYDHFFGYLQNSADWEDIRIALNSFDATKYLAGFPFYTNTDRRFRFVRDEVLGPRRYHAMMDAMIADAGVSLTDLASGLWMDERCLRELHDHGHIIGLHSHTHPTRLAELDHDRQLAEYAANSEYLTRLLGSRPITMSHPCNSYNAITLDVLRELGVRVGFRANMAAGYPGNLEHPREDHANILAVL